MGGRKQEWKTQQMFWPKARAALGSPILILSANILSTYCVQETDRNEAGLALGGCQGRKGVMQGPRQGRQGRLSRCCQEREQASGPWHRKKSE